MREQKNPALFASTASDRCARLHFRAASLPSVFTRAIAVAALSLVVTAGPFGGIARADSMTSTDVTEPAPATGEGDPRDDASPWEVASGAEWFGAYPKFNPLLQQAGVSWLRGFYEWQTIQPSQEAWNWKLPDALVANARANNIHLTAPLAYLARWASADGGTRKFPIKNMQDWRDFVKGVVMRYHNDIEYWEVWNEFNGSFAVSGTPKSQL